MPTASQMLLRCKQRCHFLCIVSKDQVLHIQQRNIFIYLSIYSFIFGRVKIIRYEFCLSPLTVGADKRKVLVKDCAFSCWCLLQNVKLAFFPQRDIQWPGLNLVL